MSTAIEWTDVTDNIIVARRGGWWCRKISPGCANCYAARLNQSSYFNGNHLPYSGRPPKLILKSDIIGSWERMRTPKRHFVSSMTDVFGDWVPREWVFAFLDGMAAAPAQTFQVLTKRADLMRDHVLAWLDRREFRRVPRNIWLGVSVEDNARRGRIGFLKAVPAVRFLSIEPLLEPLKGTLVLPGIDWVIVGGESGPRSRPCAVEWIRHIVEECRSSRVACFVKQLGRFPVMNAEAWGFTHPTPLLNARADRRALAGTVALKLSHCKGGDISEWPMDLRVREFPFAPDAVAGAQGSSLSTSASAERNLVGSSEVSS